MLLLAVSRALLYRVHTCHHVHVLYFIKQKSPIIAFTVISGARSSTSRTADEPSRADAAGQQQQRGQLRGGRAGHDGSGGALGRTPPSELRRGTFITESAFSTLSVVILPIAEQLHARSQRNMSTEPKSKKNITCN